MDIKQLYWLAGLLEGEGCFSLNKGMPSISLNMTDEDVVVQARNIMCPTYSINIYNPPKGKPAYSFHFGGNLAISWMMTLYSLMKRRRKEKIRELIFIWLGKRDRKIQGANVCKNGHLIEGDNLYIENGHSRCLICRKENVNEWFNNPSKQFKRYAKKLGVSEEIINKALIEDEDGTNGIN